MIHANNKVLLFSLLFPAYPLPLWYLLISMYTVNENSGTNLNIGREAAICGNSL